MLIIIKIDLFIALTLTCKTLSSLSSLFLSSTSWLYFSCSSSSLLSMEDTQFKSKVNLFSHLENSDSLKDGAYKKMTSDCKNDSIYIFRDRDTLEITAISLHMNTEMYIKRKVRKDKSVNQMFTCL